MSTLNVHMESILEALYFISEHAHVLVCCPLLLYYFLCMSKSIFYTSMQLNLQQIQFSNIQGQEGIP